MAAHMEFGEGLDKLYKAIFGKWAVTSALGTRGWSKGVSEATFIVFIPDKNDPDGILNISLKVSLSELVSEHLDMNANIDRLLPHGPSMALRDALLREAERIDATVASYKS